jgi:hypothetical protein
MLVSAVEWHVEDRNYRRNIDLTLKKPDLRTWIKTATDTRKRQQTRRKKSPAWRRSQDTEIVDSGKISHME